MTYQEFINNIIQTRGRFNCGEEYHERHHILPKCMGGSDEENNLIDLYAREHFEAHRLLSIENPDNHKLVFAWWCMANVRNKNEKRFICSPEEYEEIKIKMIKGLRQREVSQETRKKLSKSLKGKVFTEEHRNNISKSLIGKLAKEKHPLFGTNRPLEVKEKIRISSLGRKASNETKKKLSESHSGGKKL